jgi:hypothetical protein
MAVVFWVNGVTSYVPCLILVVKIINRIGIEYLYSIIFHDVP